MVCDFTSFSISEQWADDNERLCEMELRLRWRRFRTRSVGQRTGAPALKKKKINKINWRAILKGIEVELQWLET